MTDELLPSHLRPVLLQLPKERKAFSGCASGPPHSECLCLFSEGAPDTSLTLLGCSIQLPVCHLGLPPQGSPSLPLFLAGLSQLSSLAPRDRA